MSTQVRSNVSSASQVADTSKAQPTSEQSSNLKMAQLVGDIAGSMLSNKGNNASNPPANAGGAQASANTQSAEQSNETEQSDETGQSNETGGQEASAGGKSSRSGDEAAAVKLLQDVVKQLRAEAETERKAKSAESRKGSKPAEAEAERAGDPASQAESNNAPKAPNLQTIKPPKSSEPLDNKDDLEAMHTISMHMDKMPDKMKGDDMKNMINDEKTPPDLKQALIHVRDTPALKSKLDTAGKGGDEDGCISHKDLDAVFDDPRMKEYSKKQSENYAKNYIPSDAKQNDVMPREITESDAAREMYLYSDSLPKHIDMETMKQIDEGKRPNTNGKMPPQVIAAAHYYTKHPEEFKKAFGGDGNNRDYAQDHLLKQVRLRKGDTKAMDTMLANQDVFFKDGEKMNRDKLGKIAKDESQKPEVREAATQVLSDPLLYGMLDNGKDGHGTSLVKSNNDGFISKEDVEAAKNKLSETNTSNAPKLTGAHKPKTAEDFEAVKDMAAGVEDDPNIKGEEGGGLKKFGVALGKVYSKWMDIVKGGLDFVGGLKIPGISQACQGASLGIAAANDNGLKPALDREENGTSLKESQKKGAILFATDTAATAASAIVPGAGAAVSGGALAGAKAAGTAGAKAIGLGGGKAGAASAGKAGASEGAEAAGKNAAAEGAKGGGKGLGTEAGAQGTKGGFAQTVKDGAKQGKADYAALKDASGKDIIKGAAQSVVPTQAVSTGASEGYKYKGRHDAKKEAEALRDKNIAAQGEVADEVLANADAARKSNHV